MLQDKVFTNVANAHKKILIVTKYWDKEETHSILQEAKEKYPNIIFGLWENRIKKIVEKKLPREQTHFIGNIQSQKIREIVKRCSTIHSLYSLKHAIKIESTWFPVNAFIQIKLDKNKDIWICEDTLEYFLQACSSFKNIKIIWISWMWAWDVSESEKKQEFQKLISLRNMYIPGWLISAGTSRDYEIALSEWIDIVRIWSAGIKKET